MIFLTKLGGKRFLLNEAQIESVASAPDTIVNMSNGHSFIVEENLEEIMERVVDFHRSCKRMSRQRMTEERQGTAD